MGEWPADNIASTTSSVALPWRFRGARRSSVDQHFHVASTLMLALSQSLAVFKASLWLVLLAVQDNAFVKQRLASALSTGSPLHPQAE